MSQRAVSLYDELLTKASSAPLSELLPSLLILAHELENPALEKWARLEMEGYVSSNPAATDDVVVPEYRRVAGQHSDIYGRPFIVTDAKLGIINEYPLRQGVAELERLSKSSKLLTIRDPSVSNLLRENLKVDVTDFDFSPASVLNILSSIRSRLLCWLQDVGRASRLCDRSLNSMSALQTTSNEQESWFHRHPFWTSFLASLAVVIITLPVWWNHIWNWLKSFFR